MESVPPYVQTRLKKWFSFPQRELHCQVVTTSNGHPHVRTMKLYEITRDGFLVVLSRTDTQKWRDLEKCPQAAVCLLNEEFGQMIVEGASELKTNKEAHLVRKYWEKMPLMIQKIYFPRDSITADIPESFGVIFIKPSSWDVLQICKEDYLTSIRKLFRLDQGTWLEQDLNPV